MDGYGPSFFQRTKDVFTLQADVIDLFSVAKRIELSYYAGHLNEHGFDMFPSPLIPILIGHGRWGKISFLLIRIFILSPLNRKEVMEQITKERGWKHSG